jgi:transposase
MDAMDTRSREASFGMRDVVVSCDIVKVLWFDGDGLCLLAKRLERGRFVWPQASSGAVSLSRAQLSMLLEGIDWRAPIRTAHPILHV